jgi:hypothetical protein
MPGLFEQIRAAVADERVVISRHAAHRLRDRHIPAWQAVTGIAQGQIVRTRPGDTPNPVVEVAQTLPDGTPVLAVWAWIARHRTAKLVTVHYFDEPR